MLHSRPVLLLLAIAAVAGVASLLILDRGDPEPSSAPPPRVSSDPDRGETMPPGPPGVFSPEALSIPIASSGQPAPDAADDGGKPADPAIATLASAARAAMHQASGMMKEFGDVEAFLTGAGGREWKLHDLPPELREKAIGFLDHESAEVRLNAALVLAVMELEPAELARLERSLDRELTGMKGPAEKNVVLALTFALHTHGNEHGVRRLEDALRKGEGTEVLDFRNGAAFVLALAADEGSSPVLRDLLAADPERLVRKHAAVGLGKIGGVENRAALGESLTAESDLEVRAWAALAVGRATPSGSAPDPAILRALAEDPDGEVRGAAAFALSAATGATITPLLKEAFVRDDHDLARIGSVAGIAFRAEESDDLRWLDETGAPFLREAARSSEDRVSRHYAVRVLADLPYEEGDGQTFRDVASADESSWVRRTAIEALLKTEGAAALPFLKSRREAEKSKRNRDLLDRTIRSLKPEEPEDPK